MDNKGQNIIEYLLIVSIVIIIVLVALGPSGFMTHAIGNSLDSSISGIENMAENLSY